MTEKRVTRWHPSLVRVLATESSGQMDCCDDDPRKAWVVAVGWSYRRAVLTHAAPFLAAAGTDDLKAIEGVVFTARLDLSSPPPFSHEGGERLEWPELAVAPSIEEIIKWFDANGVMSDV